MINSRDPVNKATGGLLDWDELLAAIVLLGALVLVTGEGRKTEPSHVPAVACAQR